ncbi:amidohydrolase family protein [Novosphingobium album (ex Hu et al. 2023)]|uniref:Amidohydrolase n=1 Tax=Novosphingobium album (ex Hu et al. 2023) TaxID=2930093 RepID=A0ABT0B0S1_9SPHN|nr:amidohydrolase family protein [Novosphingobium album (ex Hu et al. 2023)]MCJ2178394.1 amidohydrolase [Novosphingobium album (ex Hu et al. 2023)]
MEMNDMILVSVDDHLIEPGDMYDRQLSGDLLASAPKLMTMDTGQSYWTYQGMRLPVTGLNAVVGRVPEEYGMEPTSLAQMRRGCWDPRARLDDMNADGIAVQLNYPTAVAMDGSMFANAPDKDLALKHLRAYNDWHSDEWCATDPARFIPLGILPVWDMDATVAEMKRLADKGFRSVTLNDNPTKVGLPSIHNEYWVPFFHAAVDNDLVVSIHIGPGNPSPQASLETPIDAWITTMPMSVSVSIADWLNLHVLQELPDLRVNVAEGGIGWVPALIERADYVYRHHHKWTHADFGGKLPSEVFREHFMVCFITDPYGLRNVEYIGEDIVAFEVDYPHSDSPWPCSPEQLWGQIDGLSDRLLNKVTHENALNWFRFDPFTTHRKEELTVGALRARAKAAGVDTTPQSFGGARPLATGEKRRVTSGDIQKMMGIMAQAAENA